MATLYLIRHPLTQPDPAQPASQWALAPAGHEQVAALVAAPLWNIVTRIYTSGHGKARIVGEAIHHAHDIPHTVIDDLQEAQRDHFLDNEQFLAAQQRFFAEPDRAPVPEWEMARAAGERFARAMQQILTTHPAAESLAVVSHATVLTLYVARLRGEAPSFDFWQTIGFGEVLAVDRATQQPITGFLAAPFDGLYSS